MQYISPLYADLDQVAANRASQYASADPFPHMVFENFFDPQVLTEVADAFPDLRKANTHSFNNANEVKLANNKVHEMPDKVRDFLYYMNSRPMLEFLSLLTGIPNLISDPMYIGGGCHEILPGGLLKIHADFNYHPGYQLDRRLNVLVYLNKDWEESYGGHFELWDTEMKGCRVKVLPKFNTMALFSTTSNSYHGHPDPLTCPEGRSRRSFALYYYTNGRPAEEIDPENRQHSTLFVGRSTGNDAHLQQSGFKRFLKEITPPFVMKLARKLR
jgi:Rps23 Pro-64 3,4-dihydroxylase Tpa1-like proline 4-hydroxylase